MNPSEIVLRTDAEILAFARQTVADAEQNAYLNKVYKILLDLMPGRSLTIAKLVKTENLHMFYKCVCLFIQERQRHNQPSEYSFSNDYSQIIRTI